jgi:spore coat protein CotF
MYTEREMTLDALEIMKTGAVGLTQAATETSNQSLRQTLLQLRNQFEQSQQQIGQFAASKNYYMPAPPAPNQDVSNITHFLQQNINNINLN